MSKPAKTAFIIYIAVMFGLLIAMGIFGVLVSIAFIILIALNPIAIPGVVLAAFIIGSLYILTNKIGDKIGDKIEARWRPKGVKQSEGL